MTGPVAWQSRFVGDQWSPCSREHFELVRAVPHEWIGYEARELYAAPQPSPAIDLEQFRPALEHARLSIMSEERRGEIDRLMALIDGQARLGIDLAADHTGMRVDYMGLIGSAQRALINDPGIAEMLLQLRRHLEELGRRWYAGGDQKVVDEFLQLYCIESDARAAVAKLQTSKGEGES